MKIIEHLNLPEGWIFYFEDDTEIIYNFIEKDFDHYEIYGNEPLEYYKQKVLEYIEENGL